METKFEKIKKTRVVSIVMILPREKYNEK